MARSKPLSPEAQRHADWLGALQPEGLVVSVPVLTEAGIYVRQPPEKLAALRELLPMETEQLPSLSVFFKIAAEVLGWREKYICTDPALLASHRLDLPDLDATLQPDALLHRKGRTLLLIQWTEDDPDRPVASTRWPVSPQERFERLLTELQSRDTTSPPVGLHLFPDGIRLVYAPRGEVPGYLTFPIEALLGGEGRLLVDALVMLLSDARLYVGHADTRLVPILEKSRKRQEQVTEALAGQIEDALSVLLAGFNAANTRADGAIFRGLEGEAGRQTIYAGLTTTLLRLVFLLYAEDRALLPMDHPLYAEHYAVSTLADQLADDRLRYPQAMDLREGAWARLLALFRAVFDGVRHDRLVMPERKGELFDPARYPFLEGRPVGSTNWRQDPCRIPAVDDGVIEAVLSRLTHLEGQRISYRTLDVEQIGSVYESLMGFSLKWAASTAVVLNPGGVVVELEGLRRAADPLAHLAEVMGLKLSEVKKRAKALEDFTKTDDAAADHAALLERLEGMRRKGRHTIEAGHLYLQPGEDRRNSGSHYTPRSLTEPIVRRTLAPVLFGQKGDHVPTSQEILALKVCDPAMGSGAFLAEACRYLAERLVEAWSREDDFPAATRDTDPLIVAKRLIVERCLYGVDKNPFAVNLARLSMWLITLSKELPFTFVDHALRAGDAIVGLTPDQIAGFDFGGLKDSDRLFGALVKRSIRAAILTRSQVLDMDGYTNKRRTLEDAEASIERERLMGDLLLACVWAGGTKTQITKRIARTKDLARLWYEKDDEAGPLVGELATLHDGLPLRPFHWWLEFPEVWALGRGGFDAVVGNPPFGGKNTILASSGDEYIKLLQAVWDHAHGNSDLAAYFFLRAESILRDGGCFGLISTNTIAQGNTRETGLKHLVNERDVALFCAETDRPWPIAGAAVTVSTVHGCRGEWGGPCELDGTTVAGITSQLQAGEELPDPVKLAENAGKSFIGSYVLGSGFVLTPEEAARLIADDARNAEIIRPYIGGRELNSNPLMDDEGRVLHERYVINFRNLSLEEAKTWPSLFEIVDRLVREEREQNNRANYRDNWWLHGENRPGLYRALKPLSGCLVCSLVSKHLLIGAQPATSTFSHRLCIFTTDSWADFALLQSRLHNGWAWQFSSTLETRLNYSPSTCFETFPFPRPTDAQRAAMAQAGEALYRRRADIMATRQQGMTQVWNDLVDENVWEDDDINALRNLRDAMDRAVLAAYGWSDLEPTDRDAIIRRLRKLNARRAAEEAAAARGKK